jgi:hypothetical protein
MFFRRDTKSRRTGRTTAQGRAGWPQRPREGVALRGAGAPREEGRQGRSWCWWSAIRARKSQRIDGRPRPRSGRRLRVTPLSRRRRAYGYPNGPTDGECPFNLQRRAVRHTSQCAYVACDDVAPVALLMSMVVRKLRSMRKEKGRLKDRWHTYLLCCLSRSPECRRRDQSTERAA